MSEAIPIRPDIAGRSDIEQLVDCFYEKVHADALVGPIFDNIAKVNWNEHLPKLYAFWQTVLFKNGGFRGNPLAVHSNLLSRTPMDWPRFQRWLDLFCSAVNELFQGERAEHIKSAAHDMAHVIYSRINNIPDPRFDPLNLTPEQRARYTNYRKNPAGSM